MVTKLNIVVVEDHDELREIIIQELRHEGHHVTGVQSAECLIELKEFADVELMVLDLNLPGEDGISLANRLRNCQPNLGIIMLTGRTLLEQKAQGYENGADIYLTKPTSMKELVAAIHALSRRIKKSISINFVLHLNHNFLANKDGRVVNFSSLETRLLCGLIQAPKQQLESWQLMELLGLSDNKNALEAHIMRIRKKLFSVGAGENAIRSIRNFGYQLCSEVKIF